LGSDGDVDQNIYFYSAPDVTIETAMLDGDFGEESVSCEDYYKDKPILSVSTVTTISSMTGHVAPSEFDEIDLRSHEIWSLFQIIIHLPLPSIQIDVSALVDYHKYSKTTTQSYYHDSSSIPFANSFPQHALPLYIAGFRAEISVTASMLSPGTFTTTILSQMTLWNMESCLIIDFGNGNRIILSHHLWQVLLHYLWSYWIRQQGFNQCKISSASNVKQKIMRVDATRFQIGADPLRASPRSCYTIGPFECNTFSYSSYANAAHKQPLMIPPSRFGTPLLIDYYDNNNNCNSRCHRKHKMNIDVDGNLDSNDCDYDNPSNNNNDKDNGKDLYVKNDDDDQGLDNYDDGDEEAKKNINESVDSDESSETEPDDEVIGVEEQVAIETVKENDATANHGRLFQVWRQPDSHHYSMHPDDPSRVPAASLVMMRLNGPLKTPQACTSLDDSTGIQSPRTWQEQISLDDILNQSSLMTRGQVPVHRQHCLTMQNGETAVFVVEKAFATTDPRVGSKHVPKTSLEWGDDKRMGPDFC
jgi:hypothetical protein